MADFLFDGMYVSPPDRGDVFGEAATIALLSAEPDPAAATIGDLSGVLDTDTSTTWLASTGVLWAGSLATQPTLDAGGPTAVGYVVALGSGSTAVNVRWVEITPTTSTVQVTASALISVTDGDVDASSVGFTPTTGGDWSSSPTDVQEALDELGGRSGGGGAAGTFVVDLTAQSPGSHNVSLAAVTSEASVSILCPDGGASTITITAWPDSATRGLLGMVAYADDGSTCTVNLPGVSWSGTFATSGAVSAMLMPVSTSVHASGWYPMIDAAGAAMVVGLAPYISALDAQSASDGDVLTADGTSTATGFGWEAP